MKKYLVGLFFLLSFSFTSQAQPFALALNNVDGSPYTCNWLEDLGIYKRLRVQATQNSSSATWEFPQDCTFPGNVWRPYTAGTAQINFNVTIPPNPSTAAALYNSGNGGASGNLSPVTNGRYYTFNIQNISVPNSPFFCVLETAALPVSFPSVSQSPLSNVVYENDPVTVTITASSAPAENVFVRYTTNNFASTNIVQANFTGTTGTAVIPGFPAGTAVEYYVYSSTKSLAFIQAEAVLYGEIVHDMSTLEWNINLSNNYTYVVNSPLPVTLEYFRGIRKNNGNECQWKVSCTEIASATLTLQRSNDARNFQTIFSETVLPSRCLQPFNFTDRSFINSKNYYRLRMLDNNGVVSYSPVILLQQDMNGFGITTVYPAAATGSQLNVSLHSDINTRANFVVSDLSGRKIFATAKPVFAGDNLVVLNTATLAPGVYFLRAMNANAVTNTIRFIKN